MNHSSFAEIGHVPVAAAGILGYLALGGLAFAGWRFPLFRAEEHMGFTFALWLTFIEEYALQVSCFLRNLSGPDRAPDAPEPELAA